jgi:hypothetical protein
LSYNAEDTATATGQYCLMQLAHLCYCPCTV